MIKVFYVSLKNNINFQDIIFSLIRTIIKYESLFSNVCSNYLLQERQFTTSSLKILFLKNMVDLNQYYFKEILLN